MRRGFLFSFHSTVDGALGWIVVLWWRRHREIFEGDFMAVMDQTPVIRSAGEGVLIGNVFLRVSAFRYDVLFYMIISLCRLGMAMCVWQPMVTRGLW